MKKYKIIGRSLDVFAEQKRGMTMMKKYVLILSLFLSFSAKAEIKTYQCGDDCTATLDDNGVLRVSGTGAMWKYNVETRDDAPLSFNSRIRTVIVEEGITSVGSFTFYACPNIKTIELAKSVENVYHGAFDEDGKVQSVTMYDSTVWQSQDNFNDWDSSPNIKINCYGDLERCKTNFLNTKNMKSATTFYYKGKKIYTIDEANKVAGKVNSVKIRYR